MPATLHHRTPSHRRVMPGSPPARKAVRVKIKRPAIPMTWVIQSVKIDALGIASGIRYTPKAMIGRPIQISVMALSKWVCCPPSIPAAMERLRKAGLITYQVGGASYVVTPRWP